MEDSGQQAPTGFFKGLFDLSFREFVTPSIVRVLYVLALIGIGIWALIVFVAILAMFDDPFTPTGVAIVALLLWPLGVLLAVVYARVLLEFVIVVFRISADVRVLTRPGDDDWRAGPVGGAARPSADSPPHAGPPPNAPPPRSPDQRGDDPDHRPPPPPPS